MRLLVVGLDCVPPVLAFERWAHLMPNLQAIRQRGLSGVLRSCEPPITVPAWTVMNSGYDAGELGLYGFRNRAEGYALRLASSADVKVKRLWDRLGESGHTVASLFVPLTSPASPLRGSMVSCFLTNGERVTFPPSLMSSLEQKLGPYRADVESFRDGDLGRIFDELHAMREQHFDIAEHIWTTKRPDFLMMVEMGPDRLHHAAWHHFDSEHPAYKAGNPWEREAQRYYHELDRRLGQLVAIDPEAAVLVASDHGARVNRGAFCINEWLREIGWQHWTRTPSEPTPVSEVIDWGKTRAWGEGGYYARIFLNVQGREPDGVIASSDLEGAREELRSQLESLRGPSARAVVPEQAYRLARGKPPDLMVYLDDLAWRSAGSVGHGGLRLKSDDRSEDGCNHDWNGIYALAGPRVPAGSESASIFDITPTVLDLFGLGADGLRGRSLLS